MVSVSRFLGVRPLGAKLEQLRRAPCPAAAQPPKPARGTVGRDFVPIGLSNVVVTGRQNFLDRHPSALRQLL